MPSCHYPLFARLRFYTYPLPQGKSISVNALFKVVAFPLSMYDYSMFWILPTLRAVQGCFPLDASFHKTLPPCEFPCSWFIRRCQDLNDFHHTLVWDFAFLLIIYINHMKIFSSFDNLPYYQGSRCSAQTKLYKILSNKILNYTMRFGWLVLLYRTSRLQDFSFHHWYW